MDNYIKNPKYKSILAFFCAFGWSLAYPLIKIGYEQFSIPSSDLGGKIIFPFGNESVIMTIVNILV